MKLYCPSCGADNAYSTSKPNFCQKCGDSFSAAKTSVSACLDEVRESDDAESVPRLSKLDFEVEGGDQVRGVPFSTIAQLTPSTSPRPGAKKKAPKISKKKVLEQFRKEAGAIRPNG